MCFAYCAGTEWLRLSSWSSTLVKRCFPVTHLRHKGSCCIPPQQNSCCAARYTPSKRTTATQSCFLGIHTMDGFPVAFPSKPTQKGYSQEETLTLYIYIYMCVSLCILVYHLDRPKSPWVLGKMRAARRCAPSPQSSQGALIRHFHLSDGLMRFGNGGFYSSSSKFVSTRKDELVVFRMPGILLERQSKKKTPGSPRIQQTWSFAGMKEHHVGCGTC